MAEKIIEIKKSHIVYLIRSFLLGFVILFGLEHFGKFTFDYNVIQPIGVKPSLTVSVPYSTKIREITFHTFFDKEVKTSGNGFTIADIVFPEDDFKQYTTFKSYYFTNAIGVDFIYGIYISLILFLISIFFSVFKFKFT
jgi:hypothetical protein|nr:hypothetical protein [uncultured Flavobacterium sp.]